MTDRQENETPGSARGSDRRGRDRRHTDRRSGDRRTPPPPWRRPWAFVGYGVAAALVVVLAFQAFGGDDDQPGDDLRLTTAPRPPPWTPPRPTAAPPPRTPTAWADYERLLSRGSAAAGRRVRTVLYCQATSRVASGLRRQRRPAVAALADQDRRVPAAECKWGGTPDAPDFLLLVPPDLAERFAAAPEVSQGFVRRRRVPAEMEWLGRSEALALRKAGVLERSGRQAAGGRRARARGRRGLPRRLARAPRLLHGRAGELSRRHSSFSPSVRSAKPAAWCC